MPFQIFMRSQIFNYSIREGPQQSNHWVHEALVSKKTTGCKWHLLTQCMRWGVGATVSVPGIPAQSALCEQVRYCM